MTERRKTQSFAEAIVKVGTGIQREKQWLKAEIRRRLSSLTHTELCAVKDLVTTMVKERNRIGPRNRRFMTRRNP